MLLDNNHTHAATNLEANSTTTQQLPHVPLNSRYDEGSHPWYQIYSTTTILLAVIHLLFLYHWVTKKSRRKLLVSYKSIIQKKKYHRAFFAFLSHAPSKPIIQRPSDESSSILFGIPMIGLYIWKIRDWYRSSAFSNGRHLSGLPLLFYNAHILWSCRALEGDIISSNHRSDGDYSYSYARLLWGLALVAFSLDLLFTFYVLSMIRNMNHATSSPFLLGASLTSTSTSSTSTSRPAIQQFERILTHRTIGSLTIVTSALLVVFRDTFPYVPLQVFPFLELHDTNLVLPLVVFHDVLPPLTYFLCLCILVALSYPVHPIASVAYGTISGMLWASDLTSFFIQPYWSNGSIAFYLILCILSLKASGNPFIPCVEHVSWDSRGRMIANQDDDPMLIVDSIESQQGVDRGGDGGRDDSSESSSLISLVEERSHELPLFSAAATTATSSMDDDANGLHHLLPVMGDLDDEHDDNDDNEESLPLVSHRPTTMRSRRFPSRV